MYQIIAFCWRYFKAFLLIYLCLYGGNFIASLLPFTFSGSIIGMLLLFLLLAFNIIPDTSVQPGCELLIRYMTLLFIPISVGVMLYYDVLVNQFGAIVLSSLISSFITLVVISYFANWIYRHEE